MAVVVIFCELLIDEIDEASECGWYHLYTVGRSGGAGSQNRGPGRPIMAKILLNSAL